MDRIFETCLKPGRYTGTEYNSRKRDWDKSSLKIALAFPDTYEIGQSGLGLKIVAGVLEQNEDWLVERVFAPWSDLAEKMAEKGLQLCSLESRRPVKDFDILGFTLPYEMSYSNILYIMSLSGMPLFAKDRDESYPLVIGGGACTLNPEPVADFFDIFIMGDGEESMPEIASLYLECRNNGLSRREFLEKACHLKGFYVPSFYEPVYDENGRFVRIDKTFADAPDYIERRIVSSLDDAYFPVDPPVPHTETIHDRIMLEISRGCTRGCRFCQASIYYRPVRERSRERLMKLLEESVRHTGYEEVSLVSLSCTDHSEIASIASEIQEKYEGKYIELSLPSLRTDAFSVSLAKLVQKFRRSSLTFAPEVGTAKMRNVVNKGSSEQDVIDIAKDCKKAGWQALKLYFLTGLPFEEESDIDGIADLVWRTLKETGLKLTLSVSSFVPKPQTPFQWARFVSIPETRERQAKMKRIMKHGKINLKFHVSYLSFLEAVFARGDRKLSAVLAEANRLGCRFDGWSDCFDFEKWMLAFENCGIDPESYTGSYSLEEPLPWDHMTAPSLRSFLKNEYIKASNEAVTPDCRMSCNGCGCCKDGIKPVIQSSLPDLSSLEYEDTGELLECSADPVVKFRIKYRKTMDARLTSHLDILRSFQRIVRRADLPAAYTKGFHPRMRLVPGPALGLGVLSDSEWMDLDLRENMELEEVRRRLEEASGRGIEIEEIRELPLNAKAVTEIVSGSLWKIYADEKIDACKAAAFAKDLLARDSVIVARKDKDVDIRPFIADIYPDPDDEKAFVLDTWISHKGTAKPSEIISLIEKESGIDAGGWTALRTYLYCDSSDGKKEPWGN